jgi:ribosomal protein S18 acetylase RimI-like enzyme
MLGFAEDNPEILRAGASYIEKYLKIFENGDGEFYVEEIDVRPEYRGRPFGY